MRLWAALDLLVVAVFVVIGRHVHDHGINLSGIVSTAWPFVVGLSIGWCILWAAGRSWISVTDGITVSVATVAVGMILRAIAGQGVAVAFVLVALGFLGSLMVGGRALLGLILARTNRTAR